MNLQFPPFLHEGDKVAIVSPSSKIDSIFLKGAKTRLSSWGLTPVMGDHVRSSWGSYAGATHQRLKDFQVAMDDEEIKAILCSVVVTERFTCWISWTSHAFVTTRNG